jgi:hypothetical protein
MKQNFDLHVHTNASDGSFSPEDLVKKAKDECVTTIAITDHDTTSGVEEAVKVDEDLGINIIPGVEISIDFSPGTMHLCGYFIDIKNRQLQSKLKIIQKGRLKRNTQIIELLNFLGIDVSMEEVMYEASGSQISRSHIAKVLLKKGYVTNIKEAFIKYLAKGKPCYVDRKRLNKKEAINAIIHSGGLVAIAHPVQLKLGTEGAYLSVFKELRI